MDVRRPSRRRAGWLFLGVVLVVGGLYWSGAFDPYREINQLLRVAANPSATQKDRARATQAILAKGEAGVPALAAALVAKDSSLDEMWNKIQLYALGQQLRWLRDTAPASAIRAAAVPLLAELGPKAAPAVPALVKYSCSTNAFERLAAIEVINAIGPAASKAAPRLLELLHEEDGDQLKLAAAEALEKIESGRPETILALLTCMTNENVILRIQAMGIFPTDDRSQRVLVPVLISKLSARDPREAMSAIAKLRAIFARGVNPATRDATIPGLIAALDHYHLWVRSDAARLLAALGPQARDAIPALEKMLVDEAPQNRMIAATALLEIDPRSSKIRAVFTDYFDDADDELRAAARQGLAALEEMKAK